VQSDAVDQTALVVRHSLTRRLAAIVIRLVILSVFAGAAAGTTIILHGRAAQRDAGTRTVAPVAVATMIARRDEGYEITDRFIGRLEPARQTRLAFERAGLVTGVLVEEGDDVAKGDAVAKLDTAQLETERDRLVADRNRIEADVELARLTEERRRTLLDRGHATPQQYDEARLSKEALEAARAAVDAAIARIEVDIEKSVVRVPFSGTVATRSADPGAVVAAGAPVVDILETGRPQARIGLSPEAARALTPGDAVTLSAASRTVHGIVTRVRPDLSPATRTVPVVIDLQQRAGVPFGDTIEMAVTRSVEERGFRLPLDALSEGPRGLWTVLVLEETGNGGFRVGREIVEILHAAGETVFVRGTLQEGQRVIHSGPQRVVPGQRVALADAGEGEEAAL
jgi:RND family efflux transporter MFP subunit